MTCWIIVYILFVVNLSIVKGQKQIEDFIKVNQPIVVAIGQQMLLKQGQNISHCTPPSRKCVSVLVSIVTAGIRSAIMGQYMVTHTDTSINGLQQQIRISQQQAATTWSTERISDQVTATTSHTVSGTALATSV